MLAQAAQKAMGALQWGLAASLFSQAADALAIDPHTQAETVQAQNHRRSARNYKALVGTNAPNRLIKDVVGYGEMQHQLERDAATAQNRYWSPA